MSGMLDRMVMVVIVATLMSWPLAAAETMTPLERLASTPKGQLKSPYADFAGVAEEGLKIYRSLDCGGCHGGGGGGGMAAPLTNEVWIYGDDDDTLFRLITLGTGKSQSGRRVSETRLCAQGLRERGRADAALRRDRQNR